MAECWRCGKETFDGAAECNGCLEGYSDNRPPYTPPKETPKPTNLVFVDIDWDKVQTLEDVRAILSGSNLKVIKGSQAYWKLRKYLKN